jgi:hypothetical protein
VNEIYNAVMREEMRLMEDGNWSAPERLDWLYWWFHEALNRLTPEKLQELGDLVEKMYK